MKIEEAGMAITWVDEGSTEAAARSVLKATGASTLALFLRTPVSGEMRLAARWGKPLPQSASLNYHPPAATILPSQPSPDSPSSHFQALPFPNKDSQEGMLVLTYLPPATPSFSSPLLEMASKLMALLQENQNLRYSLHEREKQVRGLLQSAQEAREKERERICLEVHDGATQSLISAYQHLQALGKTSVMESSDAQKLLIRTDALLRQAIQEARGVINSLQPASLSDLGLAEALRHEVQVLHEEGEWEIDFQAETLNLSQEAESGLYRIACEAITNARKHSDGQSLRVCISRSGDSVIMEVQDWGKGFNPEALPEISRGTGLFSMKRRAELLGGSLHLKSYPGQGTLVRAQVPIAYPLPEKKEPAWDE